jgi:hypothetical protein
MKGELGGDATTASAGTTLGRETASTIAVIARSDSDEAIQTVSAERFWIASLRSQ